HDYYLNTVMFDFSVGSRSLPTSLFFVKNNDWFTLLNLSTYQLPFLQLTPDPSLFVLIASTNLIWVGREG
ncbi:MAG TPA: hypothetical protein VLA46_08160, partial [Saprospiraceae bacterium]|nr:hypothetical protein [Saprospiraceae bacterium]